MAGLHGRGALTKWYCILITIVSMHYYIISIGVISDYEVLIVVKNFVQHYLMVICNLCHEHNHYLFILCLLNTPNDFLPFFSPSFHTSWKKCQKEKIRPISVWNMRQLGYCLPTPIGQGLQCHIYGESSLHLIHGHQN